MKKTPRMPSTAMSSTPAHPTLPELLGSVSKISGHRQVLIRLNWMLEDEMRGAGDLVELLRMDAGLSARVISTANTALFRGGSHVSSVEEAVVRLGIWEIRRLLLSSIMREMTLGALKVYRLAPGALWSRSLLTAISMEVLAAATDRSADSCYTVGLLHCAGMIVIDRWLSEKSPRRLPQADPDDPQIAEREREFVGWSSDEVGAALLESWRFSGEMVLAVRHHRSPALAGEAAPMAALLQLAQWHARA
ncbi:MAG: HDOD domain-containing protein, partial [Opitutaceae bacterium]